MSTLRPLAVVLPFLFVAAGCGHSHVHPSVRPEEPRLVSILVQAQADSRSDAGDRGASGI